MVKLVSFFRLFQRGVTSIVHQRGKLYVFPSGFDVFQRNPDAGKCVKTSGVSKKFYEGASSLIPDRKKKKSSTIATAPARPSNRSPAEYGDTKNIFIGFRLNVHAGRQFPPPS